MPVFKNWKPPKKKPKKKKPKKKKPKKKKKKPKPVPKTPAGPLDWPKLVKNPVGHIPKGAKPYWDPPKKIKK
jgi:hypothetical protein